MREILQNALTSWDKYWDGSIYPYLLLGAALYLLFFEKKRKQAGYLLGYLVITLALMFCPVTAAGAGEDERQRAGQGDVGFTGKDLCTEQRIDRMAGRHPAGAHRTGHAGGGTNTYPG